MNDTVREWIEKSEGDYLTAGREFEAVERPNFDAVCFHAQQCVEKLMKAALLSAAAMPPKTHDLVWLDRIMRSAWPEWVLGSRGLALSFAGGGVVPLPWGIRHIRRGERIAAHYSGNPAEVAFSAEIDRLVIGR